MLISSSTFAFAFLGADGSDGAASANDGAVYELSDPPAGDPRRMTLSATISVLYLFTPAVSSQLRVLRYHST